MSDPRYPDRDPRFDDNAPPRRIYGRDSNDSYMGWMIGGLAAIVFVLGFLIFGMSDRTQTVNSPLPGTTTGQGTRPPVAPAPKVNPTPQIPAPDPAPRPSTNP